MLVNLDSNNAANNIVNLFLLRAVKTVLIYEAYMSSEGGKDKPLFKFQYIQLNLRTLELAKDVLILNTNINLSFFRGVWTVLVHEERGREGRALLQVPGHPAERDRGGGQDRRPHLLRIQSSRQTGKE